MINKNAENYVTFGWVKNLIENLKDVEIEYDEEINSFTVSGRNFIYSEGIYISLPKYLSFYDGCGRWEIQLISKKGFRKLWRFIQNKYLQQINKTNNPIFNDKVTFEGDFIVGNKYEVYK